ncbi:MAG: competence/damage-inducible protein A [Neisseriaceae bacterium]|nr:competence/damage-inducible protein A [Neisseriaceae bacterium]
MTAFTVMIIGDEILSGRRQDKHFGAILARLHARGHTATSVLYLPDNEAVLTEAFRRTLAQGDAVISCGGIGATPDDCTRAALAAALNVPLVAQPQATALIEERFGVEAYPNRIKMAEFALGSAIIPNPINQIAGAAIQEHYLLPGFPDMAWPMLEWVLDEYYDPAQKSQRRNLTVLHAKEGDLIPLMNRFVAKWPSLSFSCLPSFGNEHCPQPHIEFSLGGDIAELTQLDAAIKALALELQALKYELLP